MLLDLSPYLPPSPSLSPSICVGVEMCSLECNCLSALAQRVLCSFKSEHSCCLINELLLFCCCCRCSAVVFVAVVAPLLVLLLLLQLLPAAWLASSPAAKSHLNLAQAAALPGAARYSCHATRLITLVTLKWLPFASPLPPPQLCLDRASCCCCCCCRGDA